MEKLNIKWGLGELILGVGVFGHLLNTVGFSIAGLHSSMIDFGKELFHIGEPILLFSLLAYILVAIIAEMYK